MAALSEKSPAAFAKWWDIANRSPLRRLGLASVVAATTALVAKGVGLAKEIVVAAFFGLSDGLEIYLMAFVLIGFPLSIFLNAIQTTFISSLSANGRLPAEEGKLYASTAALTLLLLAVLLPLWLVFLHFALPWLASGFSPEKRQGLEAALHWLVPYYFLNGINLLAYGFLQAKRRFLTNGLLPALTPLATMLLVLAYGKSGGWETLAAALVAGAAIECVALHVSLYRSGLLARPRLRADAELSRIAHGSRLLLPGTLLIAMGTVIEQAIAASLGSGAIASLGYGYRLPAALTGILVTAIGITALPYFAAMLAEGKAVYCLHSLEKLARWLLLGGLALTIPLAVFSDAIVTLLYQRGAFDAAAAARVSPIQQAYFLQLPFALIVMLGIRTLVALGRNGVVSLLSGVAVIVQGGLAWWLGTLHGAVGIAWATTIVSALLAVASFFWARDLLRGQAI